MIRRILLWIGLIAGLALLSVGVVAALFHWWQGGMPFNPERSAKLMVTYLSVAALGLALTAFSCLRIFGRSMYG